MNMRGKVDEGLDSRSSRLEMLMIHEWPLNQTAMQHEVSDPMSGLGRVRGPEADWRRPWCKERQIDVKSPYRTLALA